MTNPIPPDDDYRPNFALGVVVLIILVWGGLIVGLRLVWGL